MQHTDTTEPTWDDPYSTAVSASELNRPDPRYDGLNRAQRRKAIAVEGRAHRKRAKRLLTGDVK